MKKLLYSLILLACTGAALNLFAPELKITNNTDKSLHWHLITGDGHDDTNNDLPPEETAKYATDAALEAVEFDFKETGKTTESYKWTISDSLSLTSNDGTFDWTFSVSGKPFRENWKISGKGSCGALGGTGLGELIECEDIAETVKWVFGAIKITNASTDYTMVLTQGDDAYAISPDESITIGKNFKFTIDAYNTKDTRTKSETVQYEKKTIKQTSGGDVTTDQSDKYSCSASYKSIDTTFTNDTTMPVTIRRQGKLVTTLPPKTTSKTYNTGKISHDCDDNFAYYLYNDSSPISGKSADAGYSTDQTVTVSNGALKISDSK